MRGILGIGGALGVGDIRSCVGPRGRSFWVVSGPVFGLCDGGKEKLVPLGAGLHVATRVPEVQFVLFLLSCALVRQRKLTLSARETGLVRVGVVAG